MYTNITIVINNIHTSGHLRCDKLSSKNRSKGRSFHTGIMLIIT